MIWFTADTHFFHENIIDYGKRPFDSLEEMYESIIEKWNSLVKSGDIIYHLGDFALTGSKKDAPKVQKILTRLHGNKWLITGNHDREAVKVCRWQKVLAYHEIKVDLGGEYKQRIVLCHYPLRSWNQMHRGAYMLHGHSHGNLSDIGGKSMDVGVDVHDYYPISLDEVVDYMSHRNKIIVDHHAD